MLFEIRANEPVLVPKVGIKRGFRYTRLLEETIDADHVNALLIEELVRNRQEATERAFANLATVLRAAGALPQDVVALTIYVVNYRSADLATIRDAGAAYFGPNPPIATLLGVQALARERALLAVGATAVTGSAGFARGPARDRQP